MENNPSVKSPAGKPFLLRFGSLCFWLFLWQGISMLIHRSYLFASPLETAKALVSLLPQSSFWRSIANSLLRITCGLLLGCAGGILLAVAAEKSKTADALLSPLLRFFRSVPVASFVILAILWFGSASLAIVISFTVVLPIFYFSLRSGLMSADRQLLEMASVFHVQKIRIVSKIYLPAALPSLTSAVKTAVGMAWKSGIAAEVIGTPRFSIGEGLYNAKLNVDPAELFAWTAVMIFISFITEKILLWAMGKAGERLAS